MSTAIFEATTHELPQQGRRLPIEVWATYLGIGTFSIVALRDRSFGVLAPCLIIIAGMALLACAVGIPGSLSIRRGSLPGVFLAGYAIADFGSSMFIARTLEPSIQRTFVLAMTSVFVTVPAGILVARATVHPGRPRQPRAVTARAQARAQARARHLYVLAVLFGVGATVLYIAMASKVPLFEALLHYRTGTDPVALRFSENSLPSVLHFAYEIARRAILPLCVMYAQITSRQSGSHYWRRQFVVVFVVAMVASLLTLDRAPPITLLVLVFGVSVLQSSKLSAAFVAKRAVPLIVLVMLFGGLISVAQYQSKYTVGQVRHDSLYIVHTRLIYSPGTMASRSFKEFGPGRVPPLAGSKIRLFSLIPGRTYVKSDETGRSLDLAPVTFVGDLWRQWGWPGVLFGGFAVGFFLHACDRRFLTRPASNMATTGGKLLILGASLQLLYGNTLGVMSTAMFIVAIFLLVMGERAGPNERAHVQ